MVRQKSKNVLMPGGIEPACFWNASRAHKHCAISTLGSCSVAANITLASPNYGNISEIPVQMQALYHALCPYAESLPAYEYPPGECLQMSSVSLPVQVGLPFPAGPSSSSRQQASLDIHIRRDHGNLEEMEEEVVRCRICKNHFASEAELKVGINFGSRRENTRIKRKNSISET